MFTLSRSTFVSLLSCMLWIVAANAAQGAENCTYFVDAVAGNDANTGTSASQAWRTLRKVADSSAGFHGGNVICFQRGQRFYNLLTGVLNSNGIENNPIVFTSYGDTELARPVLSNARRIDTDSGWTNLGDGRYHYPYGDCYVLYLWENGEPLKRATTPDLTDGNWYFPIFQTYTDCDRSIGLYYRPLSGLLGDKPLYMANSGVLFSVHDRTYLTFEDLAFEFTGNALGGNAKTTPIHHITIRNNSFTGIPKAIAFNSQTVNGIPYENHDIIIDGNSFDGVRFAVQLSANNGSTRTYNTWVTNNTVRNVSIGGAYALRDTSQDVEVFGFQNLYDSIISDNDVRNGVKASQGFINADGEPLNSMGVSIWVHLNEKIQNVRIERNRFDNIGWGIGFGASVTYRLVNDIIANNIISNCEIGIRLNAGDSGENGSITGVFHNTLFRNNVNLHLYSGAYNYQIKNNLSVEPRDYHVRVDQWSGLTSVLDYNLYVPDAPFFYVPSNTTYASLSAWQTGTTQLGYPQDVHSSTAPSAGFVDTVPVEAVDFKVLKNSPAVNGGTTVPQVVEDFGQHTRLGGGPPDIGAWEQDPADLSITKSGNPNSIYVGNQLTYTLAVTNNGSNNASQVVVNDSLPPGIDFVSATATQGSCTDGQTVTCTLGDLSNGSSAVVTIVGTATAPGTLVNTANISGSEPDPDTSNNAASVATTVYPAADLSLTLIDTPDPVLLGQTVTYTTTVTNNGPSPATGVTATGSLSTCTIGTLASGASGSCTASVTTSGIGALNQTMTVGGSEFDPNDANNTATATTTIIAPDLIPTAFTAGKQGNKVNVSDTVQNQGNGSAGSFTVAYYLSTDTVYNPGTDIPLAGNSGGSGTCTRSVASLGAGLSSSISNKDCYKPTSAVTGTRYYVLVVDDAIQQVIESNEGNNIQSSSGQVWW